MLVATWLAFGVAVVAGVYLATVAGPVILAIGVVSILAGVLYTGGPARTGIRARGAVVFLFFGLVAVNGSYYVQLEELDWLPFGLSIPIGCCRRDPGRQQRPRRRHRPRAGKRTLAVRSAASAPAACTCTLRRRGLVALPVTLLADDGPGAAASRGSPVVTLAVGAPPRRPDPYRRPHPEQPRSPPRAGLLAAFSVLVRGGAPDLVIWAAACG